MKNPSERITDVPGVSRDRGRALGAILVERGRLTPRDVERIQRLSQESGLRFGESAVRLQLLTQEDIDHALAEQFKYPILPQRGEGAVSEEVVAGYAPQSELVESLRVLRSQLTLRWLNDASRKVVAICSSERGDGRSWIAANLAVVFAQTGLRTLLIDVDMRHPRQHQLFNINNSAGLSALLTGRAGREVVQRIHPQLRLFVLPAGIPPPNPQELLTRPVFEFVFDQFTEQYDVVLLDTPAISESADAQLLTVMAGAAVMVVRRNQTRVANLSAAIQSFAESSANIIGSVMNEY
jgi:chain length determinant protein tyrosine kinase EpsG